MVTCNDRHGDLLYRQTAAAERAAKAAEDQAETARLALSQQRISNYNGTWGTVFALIAAIASMFTLLLNMCSTAFHHTAAAERGPPAARGRGHAQ
jgi:hypothetical protein